jgi:hypothetical protein
MVGLHGPVTSEVSLVLDSLILIDTSDTATNNREQLIREVSDWSFGSVPHERLLNVPVHCPVSRDLVDIDGLHIILESRPQCSDPFQRKLRIVNDTIR